MGCWRRYTWIERVEFKPSDGITARTNGQKIGVKVRNLNAEVRPEARWFQGIARHRVAWIQEADRPGGLNGPERPTIVEQIVR